jgi:5-formyltetrahydrofolate cyclo-ligase
MPAADRASASAQIAHATLAVLRARLAPGATIALYAAKASEVDTAELDVAARAAGFAIAYPRVVGDARRLQLHLAAPEALVPARFGLREPVADAPELAIAAIAAFIIPGLAFDRDGGRVGWGRGHYDATLVDAPAALRIGLAFACQLIDHVPRDPHDARLHVVITEAAVHDIVA